MVGGGTMKTTLSRKGFVFFNTIFLTVLSLVCLYPIIYVVFASFSDSSKLMAHSGLLFRPLNFNMNAYYAVFKNPSILTGYRNTLFILVVGTVYSVTLTSLGAYVLSRRNFLMRNFFMMAITFTMFFNGGLIPFYMIVKKIGLYNSLLSLIIPLGISTYNLIIMRTSFAAVPAELEEAALIDGAGHWTILFKIYIPVSKAIIAVMVLYYGVGLWNGWFYSMIFLADRSKFPLQLILREILIQNDTSSVMSGVGVEDGFSVAETVKYAVIVIGTLPILCIYPFVQKYFVKGVMIGAVKG